MSVNEQMVQDMVKEVVARLQIDADVSGNAGVFKDIVNAVFILYVFAVQKM